MTKSSINEPDTIFDAPKRHRRLSELQPAAVRWLWPGRIPEGKITVFEGDPENGKSTATCDFVARVTSGLPMPYDKEGGPAHGAVMISAEDDLEDTMLPRLMAAGADLSAITTIPLRRDGKGNVIPLSLPEDMNEIREAVLEVAPAGIVVIDPITAYLSETISSHNDSSLRRMLLPVAELAKELGVAVLLVRHLNKQGELKAMYRGGGSIAFSAAARSVHVFAQHPEHAGLYLMARVKNNLTRKVDRHPAYRIISSPDNPDAPVLEWRKEVDLSVDELVRGPDARRDAPMMKQALEFLRELLSAGEAVSGTSVERQAKALGISKTTLHRASRKLGVKVTVLHDPKTHEFVGSEWMLPEEKLYELPF